MCVSSQGSLQITHSWHISGQQASTVVIPAKPYDCHACLQIISAVLLAARKACSEAVTCGCINECQACETDCTTVVCACAADHTRRVLQ